MTINISNKQRASYVGILILVAYSMLTYTITNNKILGVITDIISGLAVIGIPILMFPVFNTIKNKTLNYTYFISRFFEGILMIIGGFFILIPSFEPYRESIYKNQMQNRFLCPHIQYNIQWNAIHLVYWKLVHQ